MTPKNKSKLPFLHTFTQNITRCPPQRGQSKCNWISYYHVHILWRLAPSGDSFEFRIFVLNLDLK